MIFVQLQVTILGSCSPEAAKLEAYLTTGVVGFALDCVGIFGGQVLRSEILELEAAEATKKQDASISSNDT